MSLEEFGEDVPPDISMMTSRFQPLNPRQSPAAMSSEEQVVVESPTKYEAPVGSLDVSPAADIVVKLLRLQSQVSVLASRPIECVRISLTTPWIFSRHVTSHVTGCPEHTATPVPDELLLLPMPVPMRQQPSTGIHWNHWNQSPWLTHIRWTCPVWDRSMLTANRATPASTC